ncbi:MAG: uroporphyrinogen-III synthase [Planctomycetia bacterium]|nr:uroporphyrinogen-III synthase [Planctomycetia bacterium]
MTRPQEQSEESRNLFEKAGATVLIQPTIDILPPNDWKPVDQAIQNISLFDWIIFSSSNGVHYFFQRFQTLMNQKQYINAKIVESDSSFYENNLLNKNDAFINYWKNGKIKIAALGPGTVAAIQNLGLTVNLVPSEFSAAGMVAAFKREKEMKKRFLSIRANRGRDVLKKGLLELGATVQEIIAYQSVDRKDYNPRILDLLNTNNIDAVIITSSAIARSLIQMFGESLRKTSLISISPITSKTIQENGFEVALEAKKATLENIVDLLKKEL